MSSNGLRHLSKMLLGFDELQWSQDERNERQDWARLAGAHECGWLIESVGTALNAGWDIRNPTGGQLMIRTTISGATELVDRTRASSVRPYLGVDRDGHVLEILPGEILLDDAGAEIAIPNDGVWYTLIARYGTRQIEPGTLSITGGSATVIGVGTQFTRYTDIATRPTILRIDPADTLNGNEGAYRIASITDDTTVVLEVAPPNDEDDVAFRVQGRFFNGIPADPDVHANASVTWELVARTAVRPTDALIAFDVRRLVGVFSKIDRRRANLFRPIQPVQQCMTLLPLTVTSLGGGSSDKIPKVLEDHPSILAGGAGGSVALGMALAPAATGSHTAGLAEDQPTGMLLATLYDNGATRKVNILAYTQVAADGLQWDDPDGGATVDMASGSGLTDCDLLAIPSASGNTHAGFFCDGNGTVQMKLSTDNGATWGGSAAIWNPAGTDKVTRVDSVLTRCGRIVLVGHYTAGSARIRYVFSDDLGTTWDTNAQAGYDIGGDSTVADVAICEDDRGNLWTISVENQGGFNALRMYRGAEEGTPVPDPAEQSDGWPIGPEGDCDQVDCFAMPNGLIGILTTEHADVTTSSVRLVVATRQQALHQRILITAANIAETTVAVPVGVGVSAGGIVFVALGQTDTVAHSVHAEILQYQPAAAQRTWSWFGGQ